jgi:hypothetical protein
LPKANRLRFVVGEFEDWSQLCGMLDHAAALSLGMDSFNLLGLEPLLSSQSVNGTPLLLEPLPYVDGDTRIVCSHGPLAACLLAANRAGAQTINDALGQWCILRHADHFSAAVHAGRLLLWLRVMNEEDERAAYEYLLAKSSNAVGVHDLAHLPE